MPWTVAFHKAFEAEFGQLPLEVREALAATAGLLQLQGPLLGRPHADTLAGSDYANMKELRFDAGDKAGVAQKRFYKALIAKADARFAEHLETLKG